MRSWFDSSTRVASTGAAGATNAGAAMRTISATSRSAIGSASVPLAPRPCTVFSQNERSATTCQHAFTAATLIISQYTGTASAAHASDGLRAMRAANTNWYQTTTLPNTKQNSAG